MKISKRNNGMTKLFKDVEQGTVFEYDGEVYLATDEIVFPNGTIYNAIILETADHTYIDYEESVIPIPQAELVY